MKKLFLYIFLGLLWCNLGFADDNDLTGKKLLCKIQNNSPILLRTIEFVSSRDVRVYVLNEEKLKISQDKWYYDADLKKVEFNWQITSDGVVFDIIGYLNRENLTFKWNNSKKIAASCSVLNSNEDPYEILNIELEKLIKIQKNKNKI